MFLDRGQEMQRMDQDPFSPEMPGQKPEINLSNDEDYSSAVEDASFGMVNESKTDNPKYLRGFADKIKDPTIQSEIRKLADQIEQNPNRTVDLQGTAKRLRAGINKAA